MSTGLDMSLDDLIKHSKSRPKPSSGPTRRPPPARATPYPAPPKNTSADAVDDSPYGVYSEHVAAMAAVSPATAPRMIETGTKLLISNLNSSVTLEDVQELFSEVGELKRYSVNYDKDGKSQGSAEIVYARKVDALDAIERYNGVLLDGKPMNIELIGNKAELPLTTPLVYNHPFPNNSSIPNSVPQRGGPRGQFQGNARPGSSAHGIGGPRGTFQGNGRPANGGWGGGGRNQGRTRGNDRNQVPASAADLDAELEQYHAAAEKQK